MTTRTFAVCCWIGLLPAVAAAQAPPRTLAQLTQDLVELQQQVAATSQHLTRLAEQVDRNTEAAARSAETVERLASQIEAELIRQRKLLDQIDTLTRQQQLQLTQQQEVLDTVTQPDAQGHHVLRWNADRGDSAALGEDLRDAVHRALQTHGQVTIHNRMETAQTVIVNQRAHQLAPDEVLTLRLPVGTVTAQLPGQPLTTWALTAPTYVQRIDIAPDTPPPTTVYRPVEVTAPPPPRQPAAVPDVFEPLPGSGARRAPAAVPQ